MGVVGVGEDVGYVDGPLRHRDAAGARARPSPVRVLALELDDLTRLAEAGLHAQEVAVGQVDEAGIGAAEPGSRADDLIEDRLQSHPRCAQSPQDVGERLLAAPEVLEGARRVARVASGSHVREAA